MFLTKNQPIQNHNLNLKGYLKGFPPKGMRYIPRCEIPATSLRYSRILYVHVCFYVQYVLALLLS